MQTPDKVLLQELIENKELDRLYGHSGLIILNGDIGGDTVETALRKLSGHKLLSAPVVLPGGGYAMIDMVGLAYALACNIECYHQPVATIIRHSEKIGTLDVYSSLVDLIKTLASEKHHRVLVTKDGDPYQLLSQMDVIRYLDKHWDLVPEASRNSAIKSFMTTHPITLHLDEKVSDAVKKIVGNSVTGAAVIGDDGKLQANFSISDLRGIAISTQDISTLLNMSVENFLKETKKVNPSSCIVPGLYSFRSCQ
jgi:CBS domain-containing protein